MTLLSKALIVALLLVAGCRGGTPSGCLSGATQACIGVGGCSGGQVCQADGMSFGPCQCGSFDGGPGSDAIVIPPPNPDGPRVLSFTSDRTELRTADSVVFTVIVTHPLGVENVIGGQLQDQEGRTYGVLATTAQEGAYGIMLSYEQINSASAVTSQTSATRPSREFLARLFDSAGIEAVSNPIRITFTCSANTSWLCGGRCEDTLTSSQHCGACDQPAIENAFCRNGVITCGPDAQMCGETCNRAFDPDACGDFCLDCPAAGSANPQGVCEPQFDSYNCAVLRPRTAIDCQETCGGLDFCERSVTATGEQVGSCWQDQISTHCLCFAG